MQRILDHGFAIDDDEEETMGLRRSATIRHLQKCHRGDQQCGHDRPIDSDNVGTLSGFGQTEPEKISEMLPEAIE